MSLEFTSPKSEKLIPIYEEENFVSYLGVKLEKAKNSVNAPKKEQYKDYINDKFSLEFQKKIAVSFHQGDPILVEGGTSIGKTTTTKKMCADLGWEVHYANLNGATDVEDLMGRYVPNPHRKSTNDPEYIFADGKITSGLRQEEGKIKVIIVDEYNSASPNIVIRLHEVLDALERNGEIVLSEDASEVVRVNKGTTKVIALTNPPGKGYLQREPLDPAQIRRWVYQKEVTDLPEETFDYASRALFNLAKTTEKIQESAYIFNNENVLTMEQIKEIPGIENILPKYLEFHKGVKELLVNRSIAQDQPQKFTFDDREEPKRVRDFVASFYRGDISKTFQDALRYYYSGKILEKADKDKIDELINTVEYTPPTSSKRKGTEDVPFSEEMPENQEAEPEVTSGTFERVDIKEAEKIFGKDFLGPKQVESAFGVRIESVPAVPFSKAELETAKSLGQQLIFQGNKAGDGKPMTIRKINEILKGKTSDGGKFLYSSEEGGIKSDAWFKDEKFLDEPIPSGWRLSSKNCIPDSKSKNYLEQTETLIAYIKKEIFKGKTAPKEYEEAFKEFDRQKDNIKKLLGSDVKAAGDVLENLKISKLARENPAEMIYRIALNEKTNKEKSLSSEYAWSSRRASGGSFVRVGYFASDGASVNRYQPVHRRVNLGFSLSRMK